MATGGRIRGLQFLDRLADGFGGAGSFQGSPGPNQIRKRPELPRRLLELREIGILLLIIRDLADRLTTATELVKALDRPQPQVEIEARIVQTTRDFARALGVQWGFNGYASPQLGNTTNLAFPNSGAVGGRLVRVVNPTALRT